MTLYRNAPIVAIVSTGDYCCEPVMNSCSRANCMLLESGAFEPCAFTYRCFNS